MIVRIRLVLGWNGNGVFDDVTFQYRPILLELLHCNSTVTYRELANRAQEKLSEKPPRDTLLRLLKVNVMYMMCYHGIHWLQDTCVHKGTSKWTIINESR